MANDKSNDLRKVYFHIKGYEFDFVREYLKIFGLKCEPYCYDAEIVIYVMEDGSVHWMYPSSHEDRYKLICESYRKIPIEEVFKYLGIDEYADVDGVVDGYAITEDLEVVPFIGMMSELIFSRKEYAESCVAMAKLSQIIKNDMRFGGEVTDEEWKDDTVKYCLMRRGEKTIDVEQTFQKTFPAFHNKQQALYFRAVCDDLLRKYFCMPPKSSD